MPKLKPNGKTAAIVLLLANSPTALPHAALCQAAGTTNIKTALWRLTGKSFCSCWFNRPLIQRVRRGLYSITPLGLEAALEVCWKIVDTDLQSTCKDYAPQQEQIALADWQL